MKMRPMSEILEENDPMVRIADALEEILRMVKTDQERAQEARIHHKMEEEQTKHMEEPKPDLPEDVPFKGRL